MENNHPSRFVVSIIWFLLVAMIGSALFHIWTNPLALTVNSSSILSALYAGLFLFIVPAVLFAAMTSLKESTARMTIIYLIIFLVIAFFVLAKFYFAGEGGLGLIISYGIIAVAMICAAVVGGLFRLALLRNEKIMWWSFIFPLVMFILIFYRVQAYQGSNSVSDCESLSTSGKIYCYDKMARQTNNPILCYAIQGADNFVQSCLRATSLNNQDKLNPKSCTILSDVQAKGICTLDLTFYQSGVTACEKSSTYDVGSCLRGTINANYLLNKNTDCSVLSNKDNKMKCYADWAQQTGLSYSACGNITNVQNKNLCYYSYALYDVSSFNAREDSGVCALITDATLRKDCIMRLQ